LVLLFLGWFSRALELVLAFRWRNSRRIRDMLIFRGRLFRRKFGAWQLGEGRLR
jgi:hypothetical protein